jgi:co-chaperonin GroES (HSP10)
MSIRPLHDRIKLDGEDDLVMQEDDVLAVIETGPTGRK